MTIQNLEALIKRMLDQEKDLDADLYRGRRTAFKLILALISDD